jgi:hypothetical protein
MLPSSSTIAADAYWAGTRDEEDVATGFLSRLLGRPAEAEDPGHSQSAIEDSGPPVATQPEVDGPMVVVYLRLSDPEMTNDREQLQLFALEDRLMKEIYASGAGTYEGNFLDRGFLRLYAAGSDIDRLEEVVRRALGKAPPGSILLSRRGPAGTPEERTPL